MKVCISEVLRAYGKGFSSREAINMPGFLKALVNLGDKIDEATRDKRQQEILEEQLKKNPQLYNKTKEVIDLWQAELPKPAS